MSVRRLGGSVVPSTPAVPGAQGDEAGEPIAAPAARSQADVLVRGRGVAAEAEANPMQPLDLPRVRDAVQHRRAGLCLTRAALQLARAHDAYRRGKRDKAFSLLSALMGDAKVSAIDRATAALALGTLALHRDGNTLAAEAFYLKARALAPNAPGNGRLLLEILVRRGEVAPALAQVNVLLAESPHDTVLLRHKALLLLSDSRAREGLEAATAAVREAEQSGNAALLADTRMTYAYALRRNNRAAEAVAQYRAVLVYNPRSVGAHRAIAEYVLPNFASPQRPIVERYFHEANDAYRRGDFAAVKRLALRILKLDPNEGVAHRMFAIAADAAGDARVDAAAGGPQLVPQLDTQEKRAALVRTLEQLAHDARVGTPPRPGRIQDLYPEWDQLSELQRATVALSTLPYGAVITMAIEAGARYRLAFPGTSGVALDPKMRRDTRNAFGRYFYAIGGWQRTGFVVTNIYRVDGAARGRYNSVAHELAHVVHWLLDRARTKRKQHGEAALSPRERELARADDTIDSLYQEAMHRRNGQALLDPYSGNTRFEYLAQGMMAYLNPGKSEPNARQLFSRNPRLWHFVQKLSHSLRRFPPEVAPVDHPALGQEALGSPFVLDNLARGASSSTVRAMATATLAQLQAFYEGGGRGAAVQPLLRRAGELAEIESGQRPINYLGDPAHAFAAMQQPALLAQVQAEAERLHGFELAAVAGEGSQSLADEISALSQSGGRLPVEELRTRLLQLHTHVEAAVSARAR